MNRHQAVPKNILNKFSERLTTLRKKRGLSQEEAAEGLDLSRSFYSLLETGKSGPSLKTLIQVQIFYDCSYDYLLGISPLEKVPAGTVETDLSQLILDIEDLHFEEFDIKHEDKEKFIKLIRKTIEIIEIYKR